MICIVDYHINELLKAHFLLLHAWAQLYKKQEDIELYTLMLFKSVELAEKLDKTQVKLHFSSLQSI